MPDVLFLHYTRIYASIVLRAQPERAERLTLKKQGKYFESHHIVPRSLGGKDSVNNMALLTAREHFICHWLLVKIYPIYSAERKKMVLALWRMQSHNECHDERYINSRVYEYLRTEFAKCISEITSNAQKGKRNSQYGKIWYTNCYTGDSVSSKEQLYYPWVKGRNLFRGECVPLRSRYQKAKLLTTRVLFMKPNSLIYAQQLWDQYHAGNYSKLEEFGNELGISKVAVYKWFSKYIPLYKTSSKTHRNHYPSNKEFVGIYK